MELDKRFKVLPFCCFGTDKRVITNHIGKKGYFANDIDFFKSIDLCEYGTLEKIYCDEAKSFQMREKTTSFRFFIPECFVKPKEKNYRPYTINEFIEKFHFGDSIILRPKNNIKMEFHLVYNGYKIIDNNKIEFYFGPAIFTLLELFQSYERFYCGRWYPFGVEVEE